MKKLVYIAGSECTSVTGVGKKIRSQMKAFNLHDIETELISVQELPKWKKALPFSSSFNWKNIDVQHVDYLYIRWEPVSAPFIQFLKRCRKNNPGIKILMEIPTYPYADELKNMSNPVTIARDRFYQKFLSKYIDRISVFPRPEQIFGIPTLDLVNCICVDDIAVPGRRDHRDDRVINVVAVASVHYYYGFDRFLTGLAEYYQKEREYEVRFHLVGDGTALPELREQCDRLNLGKYVTFYGYQTGAALDAIYELADIGIDVLGGHRKGVTWFGSLKTREYMCKGLPFITEVTIPQEIDPIRKYILQVSCDEAAVDIENLVTFFRETRQEPRMEIIRNMRNFAYSYCDIRVAMNPIIEYLKS